MFTILMVEKLHDIFKPFRLRILLRLRRTDGGMDKIKVIHDTVGHTLTVWLGDSAREHVCEETAEEVVLMKDSDGHVIGFELLHYRPSGNGTGLAVETILQTGE